MKQHKVMCNSYEKNFDSLKYAREKGINPAMPNTWDDNYRKRQLELAGIIPKIEKDITSIKMGIEKEKKSKN
jgi:hypothetical protein